MSEKIHVILDTNIFRKNPSLSDLSFQALERLCKAKIAKLHIPYIVEREFQTQQTALYKKDLDTAISSLNSIIRRGLPQDKIIDLTVIKEQLNNISSPILSDVENSIIVWAKSIHAQRHAISQEQAVAAMESYFQGTPPLKNPKNRDDIPDSFIFQTVLSVANNNKPLFVIAEDDKIASAAEKIDGVFVYRNLPAFIESSDIQKEILELDVISNIEEVKQVIKQVELETNELSYLIRVQGGNKITWKKIYSDSISDDNHEATITSFYDPENIEFLFDNLYYFGNGELGIPFSFNAIVSACYYIFKADYYCLDEDEVPSVTDHNDHYFEAEEEFEVHVKGILKIISSPSDLKNISKENLSENINAVIDSIDSIELCD